MPTNTEIITDALQAAAIIADGQTASASELSDSLTALNRMMLTWTQDDMDIGYFPQDTGSDACPIPVWAEEAVQDNLTMRLCKIFRVPVSTEVAIRASEGASYIAKMCINNKLEGVDNDHMPQGYSNGRWNINTDNV